MSTSVDRRTVDLSGYPDLVVIYLGMRVNRITGIKTLLGFGPKISASAEAQPDGLLQHETVIYSLFPMHIGMRQYWRDVDALPKWTRSDPHRQLIGFMAFAPVLPARGPTFGAATRAGKEFASPPVLSEKELYDELEA
jgi:hypothetical protein